MRILPLIPLVAALLTASCHKNSREPGSAAKAGPLQKWVFNTGGDGQRSRLSGPALGADGTIYAGGQDEFYAVSPEGQLRWKIPGGFTVPPAIAEDGTIYLAAGAKFESINSDGTLRWDSGKGMIGFEGSPTISSGTVYLANVYSDLWAFSPPHTKEDWRIMTERDGLMSGSGFTLPGRGTGAYSRASIVVGPMDRIFAPRQRWLHNIGSDGKPGWQLELTNGMLGPAAIGQDGTIYVGSQGASKTELFSISSAGGLNWKLPLPAQVVGSPAVDNQGNVFVSTSKQVLRVSPDGSLVWQFDVPDRCSSGPALTEDGTLYVGLDMRKLMALTANGELKWKFATSGDLTMPPVIASDGTLYFTTDTGDFVALQDRGSPLMHNAWARYQHDSQNTGRMPGL